MCAVEHRIEHTTAHKRNGELLLDLAADAIRAELGGRPRLEADGPESLLEPAGVFVTLEVGGALNGCIGTIEAVEPLAVAVPRLASAAAFRDPRLPRLRQQDWENLRIKISILSPLHRIPAASRQDVVGRLRPGVDGLVLASGHHRATFLPTMWRSLAKPGTFLDNLLRKAGLPTEAWPDGMEAWTYTTEELARSVSSG